MTEDYFLSSWLNDAYMTGAIKLLYPIRDFFEDESMETAATYPDWQTRVEAAKKKS